MVDSESTLLQFSWGGSLDSLSLYMLVFLAVEVHSCTKRYDLKNPKKGRKYDRDSEVRSTEDMGSIPDSSNTGLCLCFNQALVAVAKIFLRRKKRRACSTKDVRTERFQ